MQFRCFPLWMIEENTEATKLRVQGIPKYNSGTRSNEGTLPAD